MAKQDSGRGGDSSWLSSSEGPRRLSPKARLDENEWARHELVRDFFGAKAMPGLMSRHAGRARALSGLMENAVDELRSHQAPLPLVKAQRLWPELVGADLARICRPVELRPGGSLLVAVDSSSWRFLLEREHKKRLLAELRRQVQGIGDLRFVPPGRN